MNDCLPDVSCAVEMGSSCGKTDEGALQPDSERLELKHNVISVRPLGCTRGRSRSNSSAASLSTALYLQRRSVAFLHVRAVFGGMISVNYCCRIGHSIVMVQPCFQKAETPAKMEIETECDLSKPYI